MKILVIVEHTKEDFEKKLAEYINKGFKVKNSNVSVIMDNIQRFNNPKANKILYTFYAYLEKSEN